MGGAGGRLDTSVAKCLEVVTAKPLSCKARSRSAMVPPDLILGPLPECCLLDGMNEGTTKVVTGRAYVG
jgi:hypothetical protein